MDPKYYDWEVLRKLQQDKNVSFHIAGRVKRLPNLPRAKYYNVLSTKKLLCLISRCHYVFYCMNQNSKYCTDICSGTVPLAFNCGTPLLMTSYMVKQYDFKTAIIYPNYAPYNYSIRSEVISECDLMINNFNEAIIQMFPVYHSTLKSSLITGTYHTPTNKKSSLITRSYHTPTNEKSSFITRSYDTPTNKKSSLITRSYHTPTNKKSLVDPVYELHKNPNREMRIPSIIHFMWLSPDNGPVPDKYLPNIEQFRQYNPKYEIRIWNMSKAQELLALFDERYTNVWNEANLIITKCDFLRMLILYIHGGVYIDLDFYCLDSLDRILEDKDIMICRELPEHEPEYKQLFNGFVGSMPKHPFICGWIDYMTKELTEKLPITVKQVMETTGPVGFWIYYETVEYPPQLSDPCQIMQFTNKNTRSTACSFQASVSHTIWNEGSGWAIEDANNTYDGIVIVTILLVVLSVLAVLFIVWWKQTHSTTK